MRWFGQLSRFLISINTIWGLMILAAFVLCVVQHYLPTTTAIPAGRFVEGENDLTIRLIDRKNQTRDYHYRLAMHAGELVIPSEYRAASTETPWLISASHAGSALRLTWDTKANGKYELALDDQLVAKGKLVTLQSLNDAALDYAQTGFDIALKLVASMVLFLGLMKVGQDAGIVQLVARVMHPVIRLLFPDIPKDHPASGAIVMNWTTTLLGLGNAATPFGLKAMKELQSLNRRPDTATDAQVMLLGYNTAGLALLPTTLLALRKSAGCSDPFEILGTCMVAGAIATAAAIIMVKVLGKLPMFSLKAEVDHPVEGAVAAGSSDDSAGGTKS